MLYWIYSEKNYYHSDFNLFSRYVSFILNPALAESGASSQKVLQQQVPNVIDYHPKYVTIDATSDIYDVLQPSDISEYDCVHPNIEGQKKLAKAWIEALKKGR